MARYGVSRLLGNDVEIFGSYHVVNDYEYLEFERNWGLLQEQLQIRFGDLYVIKVIIKVEYIQLTFEKISEEIEQSDEEIEHQEEEIEQSDEEISDPSEEIDKWVDEMLSGFDDDSEETD